MNVHERLENLEPAALSEKSVDDESTVSGDLLAVLSRIARAQMKTRQAASFSAEAVEEHLGKQKELLGALKRERNRAQEKSEQLTRFLLEIVDLIVQFEASSDPETEVGETARAMHRKLEQEMDKVGLSRISTHGQEPDTFYHYVVSARPAGNDEEPGTIVEEVRSGYVLDGTVIRKTDVIVAQ